MTLLVVDDDDDARGMFREVLELEGFRVLVARHGKQALSLLRGGIRPQLILLDLRMPEMNGFEFRRHQLADPTLASIPVIVVSADRAASEQELAALRAQAIFRKPLDIDTLLRAIRGFERGASGGAAAP